MIRRAVQWTYNPNAAARQPPVDVVHERAFRRPSDRQTPAAPFRRRGAVQATGCRSDDGAPFRRRGAVQAPGRCSDDGSPFRRRGAVEATGCGSGDGAPFQRPERPPSVPAPGAQSPAPIARDHLGGSAPAARHAPPDTAHHALGFRARNSLFILQFHLRHPPACIAAATTRRRVRGRRRPRRPGPALQHLLHTLRSPRRVGRASGRDRASRQSAACPWGRRALPLRFRRLRRASRP